MLSYSDRLERAKATLKETDFPNQVVVESTSHCNFKCPACPSPILQRPRGFIDLDLFKRIVDEISTERPQTQLWFAFMGEALMWRDLFTLIRYAKDKGLKDTRLNTNGSMLTEKKLDDIHRSHLDKIIVSIDGHSPETFNSIRLGGNYEKVRANILRLLAKAKEERWTQPEIWVQMIVMDENAHEEDEFRSFWLNQGAVVKIRPRLAWGERVAAPNLERVEIPRDFPCPWLMRQVIISWEGNILMCGADNETQHPAGNIKTTTLKQVWNTHLKILRKQHMEGDFSHPLCTHCQDWKVGVSEIYEAARQQGG